MCDVRKKKGIIGVQRVDLGLVDIECFLSYELSSQNPHNASLGPADPTHETYLKKIVRI